MIYLSVVGYSVKFKSCSEFYLVFQSLQPQLRYLFSFVESKNILAVNNSTFKTKYCKTTIFSELLNLAKLAMTHKTLNLLALNVRSKVTLYSSKNM